MIRELEEPTRKEYEAHPLTRMPYRDWCPHCVRGKAMATRHETANGEKKDRGIPVIGMDYMYMKSAEDEQEAMRGMPMCVVKDGHGGCHDTCRTAYGSTGLQSFWPGLTWGIWGTSES